jgi:hypothetical protein
LQGQLFPRKAFLLTFVEACGINLETDRRWEQAWDRLADNQDQAHETVTAQVRHQLEDLRQKLAVAEQRAAAAQAQAEEATAALRASKTAPPKGNQKDESAVAREQQAAGSERPGVGQTKNPGTTRSSRLRLIRFVMDVVRVAHSVNHQSEKAEALACLAQAMAGFDPDRAERIAQSIAMKDKKAAALTRIAQVVAGTDPTRAKRLATGAEEIVQSIPDWSEAKAETLADLVRGWRASTPATLSASPSRS